MAVTLGIVNKNLLGPSNWTTGNGGIAAANGYPAFNQNGLTGEQNRYLGTDPWGNSAIVWQTVPSGNGEADGGWNTDAFSITNTSRYRFSVWVKRTSSTTGGTFYFGTQSSTGAVYNISGANSEGNPYWTYPNIGQLTQNQWYLVIGHVFPVGYTGVQHPDTGYWTVSGGKITAFTGNYAGNTPSDCSWQAGTTTTYHRCYHYYCNESTSRLEFYDPRVDLCDGSEPTVSRLLASPVNNTTYGITFSNGTGQSVKINDDGSFIGMTSFTQSGTWTWVRPGGCKKVVVKVIGGGGGAAGYCESGGGGGYSEMVIDVTGAPTVSVTVGAGGAGVGYYTTASNGGTSSFGSYCSASGGNGANTYWTHSGGTGGVGSGGQVNLNGGAGAGHSNSTGTCPLGRGGESHLGGGGVQIRNHGYNGARNDKIYEGSPGAGAPGKTTDGTGSHWPTTPNMGETGAVIVYAYK